MAFCTAASRRHSTGGARPSERCRARRAYVDICAAEIGPDWHLLREGELRSLRAAELLYLCEHLVALQPGATCADARPWTFAYFNLIVYLRGADGSLKLGSMFPADPQRVLDLPIAGDKLKQATPVCPDGNSLHCLYPTLRCVRSR